MVMRACHGLTVDRMDLCREGQAATTQPGNDSPGGKLLVDLAWIWPGFRVPMTQIPGSRSGRQAPININNASVFLLVCSSDLF